MPEIYSVVLYNKINYLNFRVIIVIGWVFQYFRIITENYEGKVVTEASNIRPVISLTVAGISGGCKCACAVPLLTAVKDKIKSFARSISTVLK